MRRSYRANRVFDGVSDEPIRDGVVQVEDSHIVFVGPARTAPSVAETIDLGDATILPGLIDAHVHLVWGGDVARPHELVEREGTHITVLRAAVNAARHLQAGITTVRDVGSTDAIAVDIGRAVDAGIIIGPRIIAAGRAICMTGGHAWQIGVEVDGPDAVRWAVRSEIKNGAGVIKLMAGGGVYGHGEELGHPQLTIAEMQVAVEEAHKAGRKVAAHAYSPGPIENALEAGVDSIEHGSFLNGAIAERMHRDGIWLVPTLSVYEKMRREGPRMGVPDFVRRKTEQIVEASQAAFRIALEAGVLIATATDCGGPGHLHGTLPEEIELMVRCGASPAQALRCGTSAAARLLGLDDKIGTLEVGKLADIAVVDEDPLANIAAVHATRLVLRNGVQLWPDRQMPIGVGYIS